MKHKVLIAAIIACSSPGFAADNNGQLQHEIKRLQRQTRELQNQLVNLQKQMTAQSKSQNRIRTRPHPAVKNEKKAPSKKKKNTYHHADVTVHALDAFPDSLEWYPTALIAEEQVVTYIAGTPVVTSPYLGQRPAFDGSDFIVNISSINRDIRLMEQRRQFYQAYQKMGYPIPDTAIIALSGAAVPVATVGRTYFGRQNSDLTLGTSELDVAAILNPEVEAFVSIAYDESPPALGGQRISNSSFNLNLGFINVGNLEKTPYYFTAGQIYVPYGRFSSSMISPTLPLLIARTKARPFIVGYKSQKANGPFAALYGFKSDTTLGQSAVGGVNLGYVFNKKNARGEIGASYISTITNAGGMQNTGSPPFTTFGGFGSLTNGSEAVRNTPAAGVHANVNIDRYNITAEWVGATRSFRTQDLSFDGRGAKPQAAQLEGGITFNAFNKPTSAAIGYQWSNDALALNVPKHRINGVFNISLWKDTVESIEYRHDIDYKSNQFANGAAPPGGMNANTIGTGKSADTLLAQIGVYF